MNDHALQLFLKKIGLNNSERELYVLLLSIPSSTVLELSQLSSLPRSTIHQNVDSLIEKGLVTTILDGKKRRIVAEAPNKLATIIAQKKFALTAQLTELNTLDFESQRMIPKLQNLVDTQDSTQTKINYVRGRNQVAKIYDTILEAPEVRSYCDLGKIPTVFPENFEKFHQACMKGTKVWDIMGDTPSSRETEKRFFDHDTKNYYSKYFPTGMEMDCMDYLIYDDHIALIQGNASPSAIVIGSKLIYTNALTLFNLLWDKL